MTPEDAWADVRALFSWDPQPVDRHLLLRAHEVERHHRLSWWHSMIVAAAHHATDPAGGRGARLSRQPTGQRRRASGPWTVNLCTD